MSAATLKRSRAAAANNPGDHRAAAVATVKAITEQFADIHCAANGMADHAWDLLNVAIELGYRLVERNEPTMADHAGGLACRIGDFNAALHGVRALISAADQRVRTPDDRATLGLLTETTVALSAALADLERQRHWEVDLGNKPAVDPIVEAASPARAELDENPRFLMGQAIAVLKSAAERDDTSDVIFALRNLAEFCDQRVSEALESQRPIDYDMASAALVSMLDLMDILDAEKAGSTLFYAAQSLLQIARTEIDAQWHALEQAEREAAHA